jgi:L-ascorbate metabolism protein UlaG (beta-lactamase superfamily)
MTNIFLIALTLVVVGVATSAVKNTYEQDTIKTSAGDLRITFVGHASLIFEVGGKVIHIDPWTKQGDYTTFPKADLILITHPHFDHLDSAAIAEVTKSGTRIVTTSAVHDQLKKGEIMKNGDSLTVDGFTIEAVPAYNITPDHLQFHPKGRDNGYVITIGGKRIYIAGDTEDITDMANLKNIDIAFLPMNQPYTMLPKQVVHAAEMFNPKVLYPYHTGDTDVNELVKLMANVKGIEVRVRKMP